MLQNNKIAKQCTLFHQHVTLRGRNTCYTELIISHKTLMVTPRI